ncbi:DUF302 domain-containing protein [Mycolicibacterium sediminis]|uniref:DUF302 domain-containing protein n=1 Tax=Mycolicibacterium sediminis TaxID=1286180 RepID=A0A7I7QU57_9MYCO|nr:DUF302 domain-containing protein [Mycolicibacterium sediminis]BBY29909.1 hypothetical protein MSEDJ_40050 [Mycolicibacterium sediminis]
MTTNGSVEHANRRLIIPFDRDLADFVEQYEQVVPTADLAAFAALTSWQEHLDLAERTAPYGFMRYYGVDLTAVFATASAPWTGRQYLMGNHTIAERMFRHDPAVMLHAPLRTLLYVDPAGTTNLAVDQPSLLFGSYGSTEIEAVGRHLDSLLAGLVVTLGGDAPTELRHDS